MNPPNRFQQFHFESDPDLESDLLDPDDHPSPKTQFYVDASESILTYNDSPDVGFMVGINPYRGCEHGCVFCFARPSHEYLGFSSGVDFETKIMIKPRAPELLRKELSAPRWKPQVVTMSGNVDCYQPVERRLQITRKCLEVFVEFRNPVVIITKNHLVTRDIDLLQKLAAVKAAAVFISVTSLNPEITNTMEPRTARPHRRLDAIRQLSQAGIPVGVMVAPIIPGLTDHEIPAIVKACAQAGAITAGCIPVRLPYAVKDLFVKWLDQHFPDSKNKVLNRIKSMRGGKLNDPRFGKRMRGEGIFADQIRSMFTLACKEAGLGGGPKLSTESFLKPNGNQLKLF